MINRRDWLTRLAAGGAMLSPLARSLTAQAAGAAEPPAPRRFVFVLFENGLRESEVQPLGVSLASETLRVTPLESLALPEKVIDPFSPFKDRMTLLQGLRGAHGTAGTLAEAPGRTRIRARDDLENFRVGPQIEFSRRQGTAAAGGGTIRRFVQCGYDFAGQFAFGLDACGRSLEEVGDVPLARPIHCSLSSMLDPSSIHHNFSPSQVEGLPRSIPISHTIRAGPLDASVPFVEGHSKHIHDRSITCHATIVA